MTRHEQVPLMQQPGSRYRERKHVRARRLEPGDVIAEGPRSAADKNWVVKNTEERSGLVHVTYENGRTHVIGMATDRIYVDRYET